MLLPWIAAGIVEHHTMTYEGEQDNNDATFNDWTISSDPSIPPVLFQGRVIDHCERYKAQKTEWMFHFDIE